MYEKPFIIRIDRSHQYRAATVWVCYLWLKIESMDKGQVKFYNNREVLLIKEESPGIWMVAGNITINNKTEGKNFCTQCMVGGDYKGAHTCINADEIIDIVLDNISDHEVFFVPSIYLKDQPFEFKPYQQLVDEITKLKLQKEQIQSEISDSKKEIESLKNDIEEKNKTLSDLQQRVLVSQNEAIKYEGQTKYQIPTVVKCGERTINPDRLLELFKSEIKLNLLESGGVDNWEWYGESMGNVDVDNQALNQLINL